MCVCVQGFSLPEADVDDLLRAARELENAQVYIDPAYPQGLDLSARVVRLLQLALDVQFRESEELVTDLNAAREELQVRRAAADDRWSSRQACAGPALAVRCQPRLRHSLRHLRARRTWRTVSGAPRRSWTACGR